MAELNQEEQVIFQRIIFEECDQDHELTKLSKDQKQKLKNALAQKIAYEAVYKKSYPQQQYTEPSHTYHAPSLVATLCCCFYPENNREAFEITSVLFRRKICATFLFWKDDFLTIKDDSAQGSQVQFQSQSQPDLYGPLWLTITYVILLGMTSNLNNYFAATSTSTFTFNINYLAQAIGFSIIFLLAQVLIYPAAVGCLGGEMSNIQSSNLVGYSYMIYFIPTVTCIVPSQVWHIIVLIAAALLRFIFLGRNYSSRIDNKKILIYLPILAIEFLHFYLILSTFYSITAGNSLDSGFQKVFHSRAYYD